MSTLRDLLDLFPQPGRRINSFTHVIFVQLLTLAMIAFHSLPGTVTMIVLAIGQLLFIHVAAARRHRAFVAERDTREQALTAELAEANTDPLTGLPTRRFVYRHLNAIAPDVAVTVAFCDADNFKAINDQLSHAAGDDYLAALAERLTHVVGPDDLVVRLGGDEFAIATSQTAHQLAVALARALLEPAVIAGSPLLMRVSVGLFATTGGDAHTALGCAEAAMRTAKRRHSFIEHYNLYRDGIPLPAGIRPAVRPRDQRSTAPIQPRSRTSPPTPRGSDSSS